MSEHVPDVVPSMPSSPVNLPSLSRLPSEEMETEVLNLSMVPTCRVLNVSKSTAVQGMLTMVDALEDAVKVTGRGAPGYAEVVSYITNLRSNLAREERGLVKKRSTNLKSSTSSAQLASLDTTVVPTSLLEACVSLESQHSSSAAPTDPDALHIPSFRQSTEVLKDSAATDATVSQARRQSNRYRLKRSSTTSDDGENGADDDEESSSDEDISDLAFASRHYVHEVREQWAFFEPMFRKKRTSSEEEVIASVSALPVDSAPSSTSSGCHIRRSARKGELTAAARECARDMEAINAAVDATGEAATLSMDEAQRRNYALPRRALTTSVLRIGDAAVNPCCAGDVSRHGAVMSMLEAQRAAARILSPEGVPSIIPLTRFHD
jgi:competence protein ComGC